MTQIYETAYPRIRSKVTQKELEEIYTPTKEELSFANKCANESTSLLHLIVLLKTFERLGYFPKLDDIPRCIIEHIAKTSGIKESFYRFNDYQEKNSRSIHTSLIRIHLGIKPYSKDGYQVMKDTLLDLLKLKTSLLILSTLALKNLSDSTMSYLHSRQSVELLMMHEQLLTNYFTTK